jgi:N-acetylneuraminate synthase
MIARDVFEDLFVLEMTNNHLGQLQRGLDIIRQHSRIVRFNNVRAAIKLQFRDVDNFIHRDFKNRMDIKYVRRVTETRMSKEDYRVLVDAIKQGGCIPMATPFDEKSVDWCVEFNMPIIKIASADSADWLLLEKIAKTKKPVIVSVGGTSQKDLDDMVTFFENRSIPLAINHCIAAYPHENSECELNQVDYLMSRYPGHTIGWSSHEHCDWTTSITACYAKGARTFERHIDIDTDGAQIAQYSSLPSQIDVWFKAFKNIKTFLGASGNQRKLPLPKETAYLDSYIRGVYAKKDLPVGHVLCEDDVQLAIPLQKGQISCREFMKGETILKACGKDEPIMIDMIDSPYADNEELKRVIYERGVENTSDEAIAGTIHPRRAA